MEVLGTGRGIVQEVGSMKEKRSRKKARRYRLWIGEGRKRKQPRAP